MLTKINKQYQQISDNDKIIQVEAVISGLISDEGDTFMLRISSNKGTVFQLFQEYQLELIDRSKAGWLVKNYFNDTNNLTYSTYLINFTFNDIIDALDGRKIFPVGDFLKQSNDELRKNLKEYNKQMDVSKISDKALELSENPFEKVNYSSFENNPDLFNLYFEDPVGFEDYLRGKKLAEGK